MEFISKKDFTFQLSEEKIAKYPLAQRSDSKLLVYKNGVIADKRFSDLVHELDDGNLLVFNDAKVIPARLYFKRASGALIEVLLLEPIEPSSYDAIFNQTASCTWKCMVGNGKKWKTDEAIFFENEKVDLKATWMNKEERFVTLSWTSGQAFTDLLDAIGELPLPPYLNRDAEEADKNTYQTVFAKNAGSVAAPTAGLHFTDEILEQLGKKNIATCGLTLHVGAGTFLPVKTENALDHTMHREHFEVTQNALNQILNSRSRIAVGTTSLRVLESLYWLGIQVKEDCYTGTVQKLEAYQQERKESYTEAIQYLKAYMIENSMDVLQASTEIMMLPSYKPRSITALVTNFHLPESTLLFLVSSVVGKEWKNIYSHALDNNYRFLSYGDSSLLYISA